jgi:hypothetical protein
MRQPRRKQAPRSSRAIALSRFEASKPLPQPLDVGIQGLHTIEQFGVRTGLIAFGASGDLGQRVGHEHTAALPCRDQTVVSQDPQRMLDGHRRHPVVIGELTSRWQLVSRAQVAATDTGAQIFGDLDVRRARIPLADPAHPAMLARARSLGTQPRLTVLDDLSTVLDVSRYLGHCSASSMGGRPGSSRARARDHAGRVVGQTDCPGSLVESLKGETSYEAVGEHQRCVLHRHA